MECAAEGSFLQPLVLLRSYTALFQLKIRICVAGGDGEENQKSPPSPNFYSALFILTLPTYIFYRGQPNSVRNIWRFMCIHRNSPTPHFFPHTESVEVKVSVSMLNTQAKYSGWFGVHQGETPASLDQDHVVSLLLSQTK